MNTGEPCASTFFSVETPRGLRFFLLVRRAQFGSALSRVPPGPSRHRTEG